MSRRKRPTKKATFVDEDDDDLKAPSKGVTSMAATFKPKIGANPTPIKTNPPPAQGAPIEQRKPSVIPAAMDRKESELAIPDFLKGAFDEPSKSNAQ